MGSKVLVICQITFGLSQLKVREIERRFLMTAKTLMFVFHKKSFGIVVDLFCLLK